LSIRVFDAILAFGKGSVSAGNRKLEMDWVGWRQKGGSQIASGMGEAGNMALGNFLASLRDTVL
jgi:hypothetical protein